ncbi:hypothetical protein AC1031_021599 [Aphanomyces cochlioides]|nr:hypothetical protein AC1031_021599 [Aphanomyces cochlioides]
MWWASNGKDPLPTTTSLKSAAPFQPADFVILAELGLLKALDQSSEASLHHILAQAQFGAYRMAIIFGFVTPDMDIELVPRSARRQNWFKNAYNKVSPWAGPVIGAGMGAYNVYKNGKTLYGLATGRKLREMANTKTIQQVDDSPVVADGAARQLRGANYVE